MSAVNGGPAFPKSQWESEGMSLRDYFAAKALIRLTGADPDGVMGPDILAVCCYSLADSMLKAREVKA
jgi:hypothetical protein